MATKASRFTDPPGTSRSPSLFLASRFDRAMSFWNSSGLEPDFGGGERKVKLGLELAGEEEDRLALGDGGPGRLDRRAEALGIAFSRHANSASAGRGPGSS